MGLLDNLGVERAERLIELSLRIQLPGLLSLHGAGIRRADQHRSWPDRQAEWPPTPELRSGDDVELRRRAAEGPLLFDLPLQGVPGHQEAGQEGDGATTKGTSPRLPGSAKSAVCRLA